MTALAFLAGLVAGASIGVDEDRLHDAVLDFDDAANKLADLRVTLADAAWLLGKIAEGLTLEEIERMPGRTGVLDNFRALIRATDSADTFVRERVEEAAVEAVEVQG